MAFKKKVFGKLAKLPKGMKVKAKMPKGMMPAGLDKMAAGYKANVTKMKKSHYGK